jgi:hypothetical protein
MTITLGGWIVPLLITALGWIPAASYREASSYDPGGAILGVGWILASVVAWVVYGFTALAS